MSNLRWIYDTSLPRLDAPDGCSSLKEPDIALGHLRTLGAIQHDFMSNLRHRSVHGNRPALQRIRLTRQLRKLLL